MRVPLIQRGREIENQRSRRCCEAKNSFPPMKTFKSCLLAGKRKLMKTEAHSRRSTTSQELKSFCARNGAKSCCESCSVSEAKKSVCQNKHFLLLACSVFVLACPRRGLTLTLRRITKWHRWVLVQQLLCFGADTERLSSGVSKTGNRTN